MHGSENVKQAKKVLYADHVRLSVFDLVSAIKQLGVFSLNLYGCNLQKLQAMCEFRENPLRDNHTLMALVNFRPTFNN
jgi:hypothetical protein